MVVELNEKNTLLKSEKEEMNRLIQEQEQQIRGFVSGLDQENFNISTLVKKFALILSWTEKSESTNEDVTENLQTQLNEERFRYQNLLTEHLKLEERYADLRSEKETTVRTNNLSLSKLLAKINSKNLI